MRLWGWIVIGFITALLAVAGVVYFIFGQNEDKNADSYPHFSKNVSGQLTISSDTSGLPVIKIAQKEDLFYALGFLHGRDRSAALESIRQIADGSADAIIDGPDGKILSRLVAVLDILARSREIVGNLDEVHRGILEKYVNGINDALPRGVRLWAAEDVIEIHLFRSFISAMAHNSELVFPLADAVKSAGIEEILPPDVVTRYDSADYSKVKIISTIRDAITRNCGNATESIALVLPEPQHSKFAFRLDESSPIFPAAYPVSVFLGEDEFHCMSLSGSPFISSLMCVNKSYITFYPSIDIADFYLLPVEKREGSEFYFYQNKWEKLERVKRITRSGEYYFRDTAAGPVLGDVLDDTLGGQCLVLSYGRETQSSFVSLIDLTLSFGEGVSSFLATYGGPPVFAMYDNGLSVSAGITGSIPMRKVKGILFQDSAKIPGVLSLSGLKTVIKSNSITLIASTHMEDIFPIVKEYVPYRYNDTRNQIKTAIENYSTAESIIDLLVKSGSSIRLELARLVSKNLTGIPVTSARLARIYLTKWNGELASDSVAPVFLYRLLFSFIDNSFKDELGDDIKNLHSDPELLYEKIKPLLDIGDSRFYDDLSTVDDFETFDKIFSASFLESTRELHRSYGPEMDNWKWGKIDDPVFGISNSSSGINFSFMRKSEKNIVQCDEAVSFDSISGKIKTQPIAHTTILNWGGSNWASDIPYTSNTVIEKGIGVPVIPTVRPFGEGAIKPLIIEPDPNTIQSNNSQTQ